MPSDYYLHCGYRSLDSDIWRTTLSICHWVWFSHLFSIMAIISDQYLVNGFTRAIYSACSQLSNTIWGSKWTLQRSQLQKHNCTPSIHWFSLCCNHIQAGFTVGPCSSPYEHFNVCITITTNVRYCLFLSIISILQLDILCFPTAQEWMNEETLQIVFWLYRNCTKVWLDWLNHFENTLKYHFIYNFHFCTFHTTNNYRPPSGSRQNRKQECCAH